MGANTVSMGEVRLAIDRLASSHPWHSGILAHWRLVEATGVGTMAVGLDGGRLTLAFSPKFVQSISMDELESVLHHEVNHVVLGHVFQRPEPGEHKAAMTVAMEVTANEWVSGPLPGKPVLLERYPYLPPNEDTETRYRKLAEMLPRDEAFSLADDHSRWPGVADADEAEVEEAMAAVAESARQAWDGMDSEQRAKVPESLLAGVGRWGNGAGSRASRLETREGKLPWQALLRRYVCRAVERRPVFGRPPRRFPDLTGIVPGRGRLPGKPRVLAAIDTSGSLSDSDLSAISAELALMAKRFDVTVVECDTKIRAVYPYRPIASVHGRGGTDLRPPLEPAFIAEHRPDVVVYFTDGGGPAPKKPPRVPVMWVLTKNGRMPCTWGREVRMK